MSMDEIDCANAGQAWMEEVVTKLGLKGKPGSEITCQTIGDTNVTTLWHKNQPVAIAIRQRNDWNWTVMTTVEIVPNHAGLSEGRNG